MRPFLRQICLGFLLLCLNSAMAASVPWRLLAVDGMTPLVAWMATVSMLPEGILPVMVLGMMADAFSVGVGGVYPFAFSIGYLLARYVLNNMSCSLWWQQSLLVLLVGGVIKVLLFISSGSLELLDVEGMLDLLLTAVLSPLWFRVFRSLAVREVGGEEEA